MRDQVNCPHQLPLKPALPSTTCPPTHRYLQISIASEVLKYSSNIPCGFKFEKRHYSGIFGLTLHYLDLWYVQIRHYCFQIILIPNDCYYGLLSVDSTGLLLYILSREKL